MDLFEGDFDSRARKKYCNNKTNAVPRQEPAVSRKGHYREIVHDIDQISGMRALMCVEEGVQEENTPREKVFMFADIFFPDSPCELKLDNLRDLGTRRAYPPEDGLSGGVESAHLFIEKGEIAFL